MENRNRNIDGMKGFLVLLVVVGQQSLGVYLWHVLPLLWVKDCLGTRDLGRFYGWVYLIELGFLGVMFILWRYWRLSRFLMGSR